MQSQWALMLFFRFSSLEGRCLADEVVVSDTGGEVPFDAQEHRHCADKSLKAAMPIAKLWRLALYLIRVEKGTVDFGKEVIFLFTPDGFVVDFICGRGAKKNYPVDALIAIVAKGLRARVLRRNLFCWVVHP